MIARVIKDIVKAAVEKADRDLLKGDWNYPLNFLHGHPVEILQTLQEYDSSKTYKDKKYPLVALFHDFKEQINPRVGVYADVSLNIIIANFTQAEYKAYERYEKNFVPVLYPVYEALMRSLLQPYLFTSQSGYQIKVDKYDRLYWGKDGLYGKDGNVFNDRIDAIELQNLKLSVTQKTCSKWN